MEPAEYERVKSEPGYATRRIEALTSTLSMIQQGYYYPPPRHATRRTLSRADMRRFAREALDPDCLSCDE